MSAPSNPPDNSFVICTLQDETASKKEGKRKTVGEKARTELQRRPREKKNSVWVLGGTEEEGKIGGRVCLYLGLCSVSAQCGSLRR